MAPWLRLVQLGDLEVVLPAACAVSAALLVARAYRMALAWLLLFFAAIGVVGASKIAYLAWGAGWEAVGFKAVSGHAAGSSAVLPMLLFLLLQGRSSAPRRLATIAGLGLGALVALLLVVLREHSLSEAAAGWLVGTAATGLGLRMAARLPPLPALACTLAFALVFALGAWLMQWAHAGYWMRLSARMVSGRQTLFPLGSD